MSDQIRFERDKRGPGRFTAAAHFAEAGDALVRFHLDNCANETSPMATVGMAQRGIQRNGHGGWLDVSDFHKTLFWARVRGKAEDLKINSLARIGQHGQYGQHGQRGQHGQCGRRVWRDAPGFAAGVLLRVSFPGIVLGSHAFVHRDSGLFGYPVAYYFRQCFWHGQLPLWNPYNNCGIPFLAQWNTMACIRFRFYTSCRPCRGG